MPIETGGILPGVPDTNACYGGTEIWVECKKTDTDRVDLETLQVGWLMRRGRAGGRVFVLVRKQHKGGPRKGPPVDELYLMDGRRADLIKESGLRSAAVLFKWNTRAWYWDEIRIALFGK